MSLFFCKNTPNADNTGTNFLQVHYSRREWIIPALWLPSQRSFLSKNVFSKHENPLFPIQNELLSAHKFFRAPKLFSGFH